MKSATGVILATPEYHGSFAAVMKLVIENLGFPSLLAGKPVALLGVAAGQIGAIKSLEQLRSVCSHAALLCCQGLYLWPASRSCSMSMDAALMRPSRKESAAWRQAFWNTFTGASVQGSRWSRWCGPNPKEPREWMGPVATRAETGAVTVEGERRV